MSRPRAGHAWSAFPRNGRLIHIIGTADGGWITTGEAQGWARCTRCRRPEEVSPEDSGLCTTCFYHGRDDFWSRKGDYLFPYNTGQRMMDTMFRWDRKPLSDPKVNWRAYLKTSRAGILKEQPGG